MFKGPIDSPPSGNLEKKTSTTVPPAKNPVNFSASDFVPVIYFGVSIFLVVQCFGSLLGYSLDCYSHFGYRDIVEDFHMLRFLAFSLLPFGFNLAFGVFFGLKHQSRLDRGAAAAGIGSRFPRLSVNVFLVGFLAWWILFNLPLFIAGEPGKHLPLPTWPPKSFYLSLRLELGMFFFMGNRALPAGFFGALGWSCLLRRLREREQRPGDGHLATS